MGQGTLRREFFSSKNHYVKKAVKVLFILLLLGIGVGFWLCQTEPTSGIHNALLEAQASTKRAPALGPLRISTANPRYFADPTGKTIYLTGSHNWNNVQDADPLFVNDASGHLIDPETRASPEV